MSGSPVYVWPDGSGTLGRDGRLIGAIAYGYRYARDCYAGVQPIGQMLAVAQRQAVQDERDPLVEQADAATTLIGDVIALARRHGAAGASLWRQQLLAEAVGADVPADLAKPGAVGVPDAIAAHATAKRLGLPMSVGSERTRDAMGPLLALRGIEAVTGRVSGPLGLVPPGINADDAALAPGSVLSVPLAWGDATYAGSGTVTHVTADGQVLAFGHAMDGRGPASLPVATGFVHYIQPSIVTSFKLSSPIDLAGTLLRDEFSAVIARPDVRRYSASPVNIHVQSPGHPAQTYRYQVAHDRSLSAILAAVVTIDSIGVYQAPPPENTLRVEGELTFEGGRTVPLHGLMPGGIMELAWTMIAPIDLLLNNPFAQVKPAGAELSVRVEPELLVAGVTGVRVDRPTTAYRPGQAVRIGLTLQPYGQREQAHAMTLDLPPDLPDGTYQLLVGGSELMRRVVLQARPQLTRLDSVDDLYELIRTVYAVRSDALYAVLLLRPHGLAVGRTEFPHLPGSAAAVLGTSPSPRILPYTDFVQATLPMEAVPMGISQMQIEVRREDRPER